MFKPVDPKVSFTAMEAGILDFWQKNAIFQRSIDERPESRQFVFYEGPPTANARPGIHHVLARVFKDLIPRYKTMQGYRVPRKAGWDTHGLPVELEIEKELNLQSKPEIEAYGIAAFNAKCKDSVSRYVDEWTHLSERIGFWADLEHPYVTWHNDYIETCWWIFKQLWEHGLVYQDYRVTPHCPRCGTSLSDHEVAQGYEEDTPDPSVFVKFPVDCAQFTDHTGIAIPEYIKSISLVAWTTTPWTLPGNTALAVNDRADYSLIATSDGRLGREAVIVATERARELFTGLIELAPRATSLSDPGGDAHFELARLKGEQLAGLRYNPLYPAATKGGWSRFRPDGRMDVVARATIQWNVEGRPSATGNGGETPVAARESNEQIRMPVITGEHVEVSDGTGIVHTAPAFGAEDFALGRLFQLLFVQPIDLRGIMADGLPGAGKFAKQADRDVIRDLEERGLMLKSGTIKHTYPFCWRCHTPLLYYAKPSWYIRTTKQKDSLLEGNERIHWYPEHIQHGRFGNWLENNIDWAVSRERYWGTPLPFWKCEACGEATCIGSKEELVQRATDRLMAAALDDLHRPYIDAITLRCEKCGGTMRRVPEVADAWFDSGAMPYAQWHYPFENVDKFEKSFPADFICEAIDQTRGWFYTLHAEATLLKASEAVPESISFKNVIVLGHIQDEKGNKMSKSRGNAVEPWSVLDACGADATRWYMYTASPAGSSRRFSQGLVEEGLRRFLLTLWNTYSFFVSYANIDQIDPREAPAGTAPEIDRWLLSELNALVLKVTGELEAYDPTDAARAIDAFVDDLSNWYVRRSRRRFWRGVSESDADKQSAYHTLYTALVTLSKLLAPFTPFIAEELWQNLVRSLDNAAPLSVHLAEWPKLTPLDDPSSVQASLREPLLYILPDENETHDPSPRFVDPTLNRQMRLVIRLRSLALAARAKAQLRVRQPVQVIAVQMQAITETSILNRRFKDLLLEEVNAKELKFLDPPVSPRISPSDIIPLFSAVHIRFRPNLPALGRRFGARVPEVRDAISSQPANVLMAHRMSGIPFSLGGFDLFPDDLLPEAVGAPGYAAASDGGYTVAISTALTPELEDEGLARELVRRIQDMRREAGFDLSDRITTWYGGDGDIVRVMQSQSAYIQAETLSTSLVAGEPPPDAHRADQDLEGVKVVLAVRRNR